MRILRGRLGRSGFTLTEVMIVVAVVGILAAIAVPAFSGYLRRTRVEGSRNQLIADLNLARSLAISRRETITIVFTAAEYQIVNGGGTVFRTTPAADGVSFTASNNPNFYPWGLADAVNFTVSGATGDMDLVLSPTGVVSHGSY